MRNRKNEIFAIDARMIETSGIGTYIRMMMSTRKYEIALGNEATIHKYYPNVKVIKYDSKIYGIREQIEFPYKELIKNHVTSFHSPHYNIPLLWRKKLYVTIHDLIHLKFPEYLPNKAAYWYAKIMLKFAVIRANKIYAVSNYTKQDLIKTLHAQKEKIEITYNTVEKCFRKKDSREYVYLYDKYQIQKKSSVILFVGNLKPHKNLQTLIEAFEGLNIETSYLCLVGKAFDKTVNQKLIKNKEMQNRVVMTGEVSQEELVDWYNLADVFVFPSLYEGFGIPPLEAMACGTPVVCSNVTSLPEVVGNAAYLVNPLDKVNMRNAIYSVLTANKEIESIMITNGYKQYRKYTCYSK